MTTHRNPKLGQTDSTISLGCLWRLTGKKSVPSHAFQDLSQKIQTSQENSVPHQKNSVPTFSVPTYPQVENSKFQKFEKCANRDKNDVA